jgi:hypothetical protein
MFSRALRLNRAMGSSAQRKTSPLARLPACLPACTHTLHHMHPYTTCTHTPHHMHPYTTCTHPTCPYLTSCTCIAYITPITCIVSPASYHLHCIHHLYRIIVSPVPVPIPIPPAPVCLCLCLCLCLSHSPLFHSIIILPFYYNPFYSMLTSCCCCCCCISRSSWQVLEHLPAQQAPREHRNHRSRRSRKDHTHRRYLQSK